MLIIEKNIICFNLTLLWFLCWQDALMAIGFMVQWWTTQFQYTATLCRRYVNPLEVYLVMNFELHNHAIVCNNF